MAWSALVCSVTATESGPGSGGTGADWRVMDLLGAGEGDASAATE